MKKALIHIIILASAFYSIGCVNFMVGGINYNSKEEAIQKYKQLNEDNVNAIVAKKECIDSKVLVVINTMKKMEDTAIKYTRSKESTQPIIVEYISEAAFDSWKMHYSGLVKRNLFKKVDFITDEFPENINNSNYDYIIYLHNPNPTLFLWYIKGKNFTEPQLISTDSSVWKESSFQKLSNWLESLEKIMTGNSPNEVGKQSVAFGTGFAVSSDGFIVTANHVIAGHSKISVKFENADWIPAKIVKFSKSNDIAILSIDKSVSDYLILTDTKKLKQADRVFTMGYPATYVLGVEPKYTEGYVSSLSGIQGEDSLMQVSVPIQPGNSGGPLVNDKGQVVGMVTSTAAVSAFYKFTGTLPQNINWAVKSDYIKLLINTEIVTNDIQLTGNVERTKKSICFIKAE